MDKSLWYQICDKANWTVSFTLTCTHFGAASTVLARLSNVVLFHDLPARKSTAVANATLLAMGVPRWQPLECLSPAVAVTSGPLSALESVLAQLHVHGCGAISSAIFKSENKILKVFSCCPLIMSLFKCCVWLRNCCVCVLWLVLRS